MGDMTLDCGTLTFAWLAYGLQLSVFEIDLLKSPLLMLLPWDPWITLGLEDFRDKGLDEAQGP